MIPLLAHGTMETRLLLIEASKDRIIGRVHIVHIVQSFNREIYPKWESREQRKR